MINSATCSLMVLSAKCFDHFDLLRKKERKKSNNKIRRGIVCSVSILMLYSNIFIEYIFIYSILR